MTRETRLRIGYAAALVALFLVGLPVDAQHGSSPFEVPADVTWPGNQGVVELPFETYRNWIVVQLSINGSRPLRMVLDTGAPMILVPQESTAATLGLGDSQRIMVGGGGDGDMIPADLSQGVSATLGPLQISNANVLVGPGKDVLGGLDGAFGGSVFQNAVVEIDFEAEVVRFHPPVSFEYDGAGREVALGVSPYGQPYLVDIPVEVVGRDEILAKLHLDTGRSSALQLWMDSPSAGYATVESIVGWGVSGPESASVGRVASVELGGLRLESIPAGFKPDAPLARMAPGLRLDGAIGVEALRRFRLFVDYRGGRAIFEKGDRYAVPFPYNTTGVVPAPWAPGESSMTVAWLVPGSPAERAGMMRGDEIITIDGSSLSELPLTRIFTVWESGAGTSITLRVRRAGEDFDVTLTARELLS
ncbi:MAG: PDZ domain-containing protein [Acidobacteria bacterium]|nr:PDZ domain-containing protein [Acidobacteriota bacterium]